eukprot:c18242_g1_i4.p1 GENE.c18242_g1_i4~~c18242_g1_i4.p1  ORF type:complete len:249 (-),score=37.12 c18242_g1_i4:24-689(-)
MTAEREMGELLSAIQDGNEARVADLVQRNRALLDRRIAQTDWTTERMEWRSFDAQWEYTRTVFKLKYEGLTPLHYAILFNKEGVCRVLVALGADLDAVATHETFKTVGVLSRQVHDRFYARTVQKARSMLRMRSKGEELERTEKVLTETTRELTVTDLARQLNNSTRLVQYLEIIHERVRRQKKMRVFFLGTHPRVGAQSVVRCAPPDILEMISRKVVVED